MRRILLLFFFLPLNVVAQDFKPLGTFLQDSIFIGEKVKYSFSYQHIKNLEVVFPDTSYSYAPFELVRKEVYPTTTEGNISRDSAIYIFRLFDTQPLIVFKLPVIQITENGDSLFTYANDDSVFLKQYIMGEADNIFLKDDTSLKYVPPRFNYHYYLLILVGGVSLTSLLFFVFRKGIVRRYRLYILRKSHNTFVRSFEKIERKLQVEKQLSDLEDAISEWKIYLARLENSPINTFTTTEIISVYKNDELAHTLQSIDRSIYGGVANEDTSKYLSVLKKFSNQRFQRKKKEVRNA